MNPLRPLIRLATAKETGLLVVIALLAALLASSGGTVTRKVRDPATGRVTAEVQVNKFLQPENIDIILKNSSWIAVMAVGATVLILAGGIDLSIGSIYCLAAVTGGMFLRHYGPTSAHPAFAAWVIPAGILLTLGVGAACGAANGGMVVLLRVHPFIITLGTMSIFRGLAFFITEAQAVTDYPPALGETFRRTLGTFDWLPHSITTPLGEFTPLPILIVLFIVIAGYVFLGHTVLGRSAYAIGGNETAARFSGVRVERTKMVVYILAGLCAGIAAVICQGTFGSADSSTGSGYELDVIAAAVVGGASLSGGRGTALGALLGALVIQLISNAMVILNIPSNCEMIIKGAVIILAVVLDRLSSNLSQRRLLT